MNDNGLPSGTVVLSASNPNAALEAKGYSLVYSDANSPEDWAVALDDKLVIPLSDDTNQMEMVTFGSYVGFYNEQTSSTEGSNPFYYSQDGIFWNESTLPFNLPNTMYGDVSVELNASLYMVSPNEAAADGGAPLRVATTANGVDWTELSVSLPVSNVAPFELEAFANQIWLFGYNPEGGSLLFKSSDGATWDPVATPAWETAYLETVSTPDRLVVLAHLAGSTGKSVWSTTDGSSWTISTEVIPDNSSSGTDGPEMTYANGALWTFGMPEGETTFQALYKSTDWGNSWSRVTTNLPTNQYMYNAELMALAPSPGLLYAFGDGASDGGTYISEDGSDWNKVSSLNLENSYGEASVSSNGKVWISYLEDTDIGLYSIGGPLRNGRFFYYQKD
jgi:hypothetical protein